MKVNSLSTLITFFLLNASANAFAPSTSQSRMIASTQKQTQLQMGLFDIFLSPEEREKQRLKKEAEIEEQERLLEEMRERRTNPEKMEEYEYDVLVRRNAMKNQKRDWEKFEEKIGEDGIRVVGKEEN
mmetsp:Transcript_21918/g.32817  ORF Transcript_21918/g.32817 Transcript_21918/m.32817 type:complete len:128 (-) Transcript_21918:389-772(-)